MNILVADDSDILSNRVVSILSELSCVNSIWQTKNIKQTLELMNNLIPNVIILDIHFPDGSGLDVLKKVKIKYPKIKVLMLTNFSFPQYRTECKKIGADFFLDKATEFEQISDIINSISETFDEG